MSYALGPRMKIMMEEADFTSQHSLEVSQQDSCHRIKHMLKVVSSSLMLRRACEVGMPWTMR
jgi:hypothetical protein